jgi:hypothetical protein
MRAVMTAYHDEKWELEGESRVILVIRGLMRVVKLSPLDVWTLADVSDISPERVQVTASQMVAAIKAIVAEEEDTDEFQEGQGGDKSTKPWYYSARSVGRLLSKLRLKEERDSSPKRERSRVTSAKDVFSLALAHHLVHLKDEMSEPDVSRTPQHTQDRSADPSGQTDDMSGRLERTTPDDPPQSSDMHAAHTHLSGKTSESSSDVQTSDPDDPIEPKNADDGHIHRMCSGTDEGRGGSCEIPAPHEE